MKNRIIVNPINGDKVTFLETCEETNGEAIKCELEVFPNAQGTSAAPPHYHRSYIESFHVLEGELTVLIGNKTHTLSKGQSASVPMGTVHTFSNKTSKTVRAIVEAHPGLQGFENGLYIMYGLARDGKTTKAGMPKSISNLAVLLLMGDIRLAGIMSIANPIMKWIGKRAISKGVDKELINTYCK